MIQHELCPWGHLCLALPLGLDCKWSVGRGRHKARGEGSISLPQGMGVPTPGSWNGMPWDAREEWSRAPGTVSLKAALRVLPSAKSLAAGGVALLGHCWHAQICCY